MKKLTRGSLLTFAGGAAVAAAFALMPTAAQAQIDFGITFGPGGPSVTIGTPGSGQVCFFERSRYRGEGFCVEDGTTIRDLDDWDGEISSFRNPDGLEVTLCTRTRLRGVCRTYTGNARTLGDMDKEAASLRVR